MIDTVVWLTVSCVLIGVLVWRTVRLMITDGYGSNPPPRSHPPDDGRRGAR